MKLTYTKDDHEIWSVLMKRKGDLLSKACKEYLEGYKVFNFSDNMIPDFEDINSILFQHIGWKYLPTYEVVSNRYFLECLSRKKFVSSINIRPIEELEFCKLPDVFHDVFGHAPLLLNKQFSDYLHNLGKLVKKDSTDEHIAFLSRIYWYTAEVGLVMEAGELKHYGGSIISSISEVNNIYKESSKIIPADIDQIIRAPYDSYQVNPYYFLLDCFDQISMILNFQSVKSY